MEWDDRRVERYVRRLRESGGPTPSRSSADLVRDWHHILWLAVHDDEVFRAIEIVRAERKRAEVASG